MPEQADYATLVESLAPRLSDRRLADSPILRGLPPGEYMRPFLTTAHPPFSFRNGINGYYAQASVLSGLLVGPLTTGHIKIMNVMHAEKKLRQREYVDLPQDTLLSVIMPTRNRQEEIEGSILSVMVQSYANWELLIIDDAGERGVEKVVAAFNDPRIRYYRLEEPLGAPGARNLGLAQSRGRYIAYLDDDDQWDPDFLLISYGELVRHKRRFAYSAQMVWRGFSPESNLGRDFIQLRYVPFNRSYMENINFISMISCLHDRTLYEEAGGFEPGLKKGQDWEFFLRLVDLADPVEIPCILSHYYMFRFERNVSSQQGPLLMAFRTNALQRARAKWHSKVAAGDGNRTFELYSLSEAALRHRKKRLPRPLADSVEIIIAHRDTPEKLDRCLASLKQQTALPYAVFVAGPPASPEEKNHRHALSGEHEKIRIHAGIGETLAAALAGKEPGHSDFMVLTDSNTLFTDNWLEELLFVFKHFPDAGMAVPRCTLPPRSPALAQLAPQMFSSFEADIALYPGNVLRPNVDREGYFELEHLQGFSALLLPSSLLGQAAHILESGFEEQQRQALCHALRNQMGKKIYYTPFSKLYLVHSRIRAVEA